MAQTTEPSPNLNSSKHKCNPPEHFKDNRDLVIKKQKTMLTMPIPSTAQPSASLTGPQNNHSAASASPPCAQRPQPCVPQDANNSDDNDSHKSNPEPIEVSNGDDDIVEVIEDNDKELGECGIPF
jgi:hypothetical protein